MRRSIVVCLVVSFVAVGGVYSQSSEPDPNIVFPQYVQGETGGFLNYTRLVLRNPSGEDDKVLLRFYATGSTESPADHEVEIPAMGTAEFRTSGEGDFEYGAITVTSLMQGDASAVQGDLIYELLGYRVSVPPSEQVTSAEFYVSRDDTENTGLAVYNLHSEEMVTLNVSLRDQTGMEVETTTLMLEPGEHLARFVHEEPWFPGFFAPNEEGVSLPFAGTIAISEAGETPKPFTAVGLLQDTTTGAVSTFQSIVLETLQTLADEQRLLEDMQELEALAIVDLRAVSGPGPFGGVAATAVWEQTPGAIGYSVEVMVGEAAYIRVIDASCESPARAIFRGNEDDEPCDPRHIIYPATVGEEITFQVRAISESRLGNPSQVSVTVTAE